MIQFIASFGVTHSQITPFRLTSLLSWRTRNQGESTREKKLTYYLVRKQKNWCIHANACVSSGRCSTHVITRASLSTVIFCQASGLCNFDQHIVAFQGVRVHQRKDRIARGSDPSLKREKEGREESVILFSRDAELFPHPRAFRGWDTVVWE